MTNSLKSAESEVMNAFSKLASMSDLKKLVEAPDVFIAAVALSGKDFYEGRGDRTSFFECILELNPSGIPDLGRKIALVSKKEFMGLKLYNDKICNPERVNKQTVYRLWMHCCRVGQTVTLEQMIEFQPHLTE